MNGLSLSQSQFILTLAILAAVAVAVSPRESIILFADDDVFDAHRKEAAQNGTQPADALKVISVSDETFDEMFRQRSRFRGVSQFSRETRLSQLAVRKNTKHLAMFRVQSPTRHEDLTERILTIDRSKGALDAVNAFPYYPETTQLYVRHALGFNESTAEEPVPLVVLKGLLQLPYLELFSIDGGTWNSEAVQILAKHPSLRVLGLGHCRISEENFSHLAKLKTLERFGFSDGLTPRCLVTLAKLPRIRAFSISDNFTDGFGNEIDEETRRAIESMDGRLQSFTSWNDVTPIHPSITDALLKLKSVKETHIGSRPN